MNMFALDNHVAVVTGGNRGIGIGYARGLIKAGASVAIWARSEEFNERACRELTGLGGQVLAIQCDVASEADVNHAIEGTVERFSRVDSLFANASMTTETKFPSTKIGDWSSIMRVNLDGTFLCLRAASERMIEQGSGGSLIVTASVAAHHGLPVSPHYSASKAGQIGLVKALAVRLARYRIRVNAILPGWVTTDMTKSQQDQEAFQEALKLRVPLRRWGAPEDFEGVAVYLASELSSFMTGAELILDGGYSAY